MAQAAVKREFVGITDQALDELRGRIGKKIGTTVEPWCYEATRDNIRHYAHGIGDDNPLWCDPSYAAGTRYGTVIAPPSFLFPLNRILSGYVGGLPGIHAMWAGGDLEWVEPITRGTEVRTEAYLKELIEHQTRFAGRAITKPCTKSTPILRAASSAALSSTCSAMILKLSVRASLIIAVTIVWLTESRARLRMNEPSSLR